MASMPIANEITGNLAEAAEIIRSVAIPMKIPVIMHGQPGIGKTEMINQLVGAEPDMGLWDIRLGQKEYSDIAGIPFFNPKKNVMEIAPSDEFPWDKDAKGVVFLDEITNTDPRTQTAALQYLLERRLGVHKVPENIAIVAAGNRKSDRAGSRALISSLKNRFVHINVEFSFDVWFDWAVANDAHPDVLGFLKAKPEMINTFDPTSSANSFATPRSWIRFVSDVLKAGRLSENLNLLYFAGAVGMGPASGFLAMRKILSKLPKPEDVIDGKVTTLPGNNREVTVQYSLTTSTLYLLKERRKLVTANKLSETEWLQQANNLVQFAVNNFETETTTMLLKFATAQYALPFRHAKMPALVKFVSENKALFSHLWDYSA